MRAPARRAMARPSPRAAAGLEVCSQSSPAPPVASTVAAATTRRRAPEAPSRTRAPTQRRAGGPGGPAAGPWACGRRDPGGGPPGTHPPPPPPPPLPLPSSPELEAPSSSDEAGAVPPSPSSPHGEPSPVGSSAWRLRSKSTAVHPTSSVMRDSALTACLAPQCSRGACRTNHLPAAQSSLEFYRFTPRGRGGEGGVQHARLQCFGARW